MSGDWEKDPEVPDLSLEVSLAELVQAKARPCALEEEVGALQQRAQQWGQQQVEVQTLESIYGQFLGTFGQGDILCTPILGQWVQKGSWGRMWVCSWGGGSVRPRHCIHAHFYYFQ